MAGWRRAVELAMTDEEQELARRMNGEQLTANIRGSNVMA